MQNEFENDFYLADWLDGKISDEGLRELVSDADFIAFQKLRLATVSMAVQQANLEASYEAIQRKIELKSKARKLAIHKLYASMAVAAMLVLLFGLYQLFFFSNEVTTTHNEINTVTLDDRSKVSLGSMSKISYPTIFKFNRRLKLEGEAFFEVEKGGSFVVDTKVGTVQVLGTKFNVIARPDFFEVICYEGKVQITTKTDSEIISKGMAVRFYDNILDRWTIEGEEKPRWLDRESSFRQLPLKYVIEQLQLQYDCHVQYPASFAQIKITVSFPHDNIDVALKSICIPLHLKYAKRSPRQIVITE